MTIRVLAEVTLLPTQLHEMDEIVRKLAEYSLQDRGCMQYEVFKKSNGFVFIEQWQDESALKEHETQVHFQKFLQALNDTKADLKIESLTEFVNHEH